VRKKKVWRVRDEVSGTTLDSRFRGNDTIKPENDAIISSVMPDLIGHPDHMIE